MIQFNLLPNVKQEYVKAKRTQRMVLLISVGVGAASLFLLMLMLVTVDVVQKKSLHDLNTDISKYSNQLKSVADLDKILTVQNQLTTLTGLHDAKPVVSRLFGDIAQMTPNQVSISNLSVDYAANTATITGATPSLDVVNAYIDTLKTTKYRADASTDATQKLAFSKVVLSTFGRDTKGATYTITFSFDPAIFSNTGPVTLVVPSGTTGAQATLFQKGGSN